MVPVALSELLEALRDSELVPAAELDAVLTGSHADAALPSITGELVRRGWLTPYQADEIASDHVSDLLLGPYLLLDRLGEGGMGQVFRARHRLMNRTVALKLIRADRVASPEAVSRFRREVKAIAQLAHPNIVLAYDAAQEGDRTFLVMEYVPGTDLAALVKERGPLAAGQACDFIRQAALGLAHAHERGIVHRDVKPGNLLLAADTGVVKVLDLGLARLRDAGSATGELTCTGQVMGTPDFMAPEQAGDFHAVDARADVYSLGCTLYYLLAGKPPFPGGHFLEKLQKHREIDPLPIELARAGVPRELGDVVRRMMAKRQVDRFQSAAAIAAALAPLASHSTPVAMAVPPAGPLPLPETAHDTSPSALFSTAKGPLVPPTITLTRRKRSAAKLWTRRRIVALSLLAALFIVSAAVAVPTILIRIRKDGVTTEARFPRGSKVDVDPAGTLTVTLPDAQPPTNAGAAAPAAAESADFELLFDGVDDLVEIPRFYWELDEPLTFEATIRPHAVPRTPSGNPLDEVGPVFYHTRRNGSHLLGFNHGRGLWYVHRWSFGRGTGLHSWTQASLHGVRHRLAVIWTGQNFRFFVDGRESTPGYDDQPLPATARSFDGPAQIGYQSLLRADKMTWSPRLFRGTIDEIRISSGICYDADYTPGARLEADKRTLVLFHCDEARGGTLVDSSGNGNDGRVLGPKWVRVGVAASGRDRPPAPKVPFDAAAALAHQQAWADYLRADVEHVNSVGMKLRLIPPGEFLMGSSEDEIMRLTAIMEERYGREGRRDSYRNLAKEAPERPVSLSAPFYLGVHEVTQEQYERVMGRNPAHYGAQGAGKETVAGLDTARFPVDTVHWHEAVEFCNRLSRQEGLQPWYAQGESGVSIEPGTGYRLPRESEWEFAAIGGQPWTWSNYDDLDRMARKSAWFSANCGDRPHVVGELEANGFGLFDMLGNVCEWCEDEFDPSVNRLRTARGGAWRWACEAVDARAEVRGPKAGGAPTIGFRIVLDPGANWSGKPASVKE